MSTFNKEHPEYARIEEQIRRANAERALVIGEAIGNGIVAVTRAVQGLFHRRVRKPA